MPGERPGINVSMVERRDASRRLIARWWPIRWTSPLVSEPPRPISLFDVAEVRAVVDTNRVAAGLAPVNWVGRTDDDPTFVAGLTPIRAVHFTQLRTAIAELWHVADLGPVPEFRAGPIVPGRRVISVRDPLDLRAWIEAYEAARPDLAARVAWRYGVIPNPWPTIGGLIPKAQIVELWDVTGHSLFWNAPDEPSAVELRRIDTHWYQTTLDENLELPTASISIGRQPAVPSGPDPSASGPGSRKGKGQRATCASAVAPDDEPGKPRALRLPTTLSKPTVRDHDSVRYVTWDATPPAIDSEHRVEYDFFGRVVRVLAGDDVVVRLAYDGLGRLRKITDTSSWHVVGPDMMVPAMHPPRGAPA